MKTVLITGASRGIGRAIALALAAADNEITTMVMVARSEKLLDELAKELTQTHPDLETVIIATDLSDTSSPERLFAELDRQNILLNVIINNAGFTQPANIKKITLDDFEKTINVNLISPFKIIQHARHDRHPIKLIINIGSTAGINGRAGWLTYSTSKAALINMSEVLREELAPEGIPVVCLSPGRCATDLRKRLAPKEDPSKIMQPEQVADIVVVMMSPIGRLLDSQNLVVRT